jgi:hypothetical protein
MEAIGYDDRPSTEPIKTQVQLLQMIYEAQIAEIERKKAFDTVLVQWHKVAVEEQKVQTKHLSSISLGITIVTLIFILGFLAGICLGTGFF